MKTFIPAIVLVIIQILLSVLIIFSLYKLISTGELARGIGWFINEINSQIK